MDASALHCPNCGAIADPEARRCPYCKARLATISCPSCFALMFDGAAFCPRCGVRRARSEATDVTARCPGCAAGLTRVDLGSTPLLECQNCDGVWVDADVFERICADREAQSAVLHRVERRADVRASAPVKYRPCVRCGTMMNRINFGRVSGAVVDVCRGHGTFLDADELHQIVTFVQNGGLERVRRLEIEELRIEQARLRAAQQAAHSGSSLSVSNSVAGADTRALHELLRTLLGRLK